MKTNINIQELLQKIRTTEDLLRTTENVTSEIKQNILNGLNINVNYAVMSTPKLNIRSSEVTYKNNLELTPDLWITIFLHLSGKDLISATLACRLFANNMNERGMRGFLFQEKLNTIALKFKREIAPPELHVYTDYYSSRSTLLAPPVQPPLVKTKKPDCEQPGEFGFIIQTLGK